MSTHAADSSADVGVDSTTLAALSLTAASADRDSQSPVTSSRDQQPIPAGSSKEASGGSAKRSTYRQKNQSQFYRPRRDFPSTGFEGTNTSSERGRYPRRSFGRGPRPSAHSFSTPSDQTTQAESGTAPTAPNSAPSSHKFITRRRPPPRPEKIKPNDVFISLKTNYKAHCDKCKKLLDGKFSEIHLHALLEAIPVAINVAIELKKFFQGTVDFTTRTETVNLIDDLIPTDDSTAPSFARRKVSSINIRVFRTVNIP